MTGRKLVNGSRLYTSQQWLECRTIGKVGWAYAVAVIVVIVTLGKRSLSEERNHEELASYVRHTYGVIVAVARHDC